MSLSKTTLLSISILIAFFAIHAHADTVLLTPDTTSVSECSDGKDNDNDGKTDYPDDTDSCTSLTDSVECETCYTLLAPLPIGGDGSITSVVNIGANDGAGGNFDFGDYFNGLLKFAIGIAGALAVVMIVVGGIQYMSTDNFGEKAVGKEHIKNAVGGMILLLGAYMILNTLNPNLVDFNFSISEVSVEAAAIIDTGEYGEAPQLADGSFDYSYCATPPNTAAGCASCKKIAGVTFKETITSDTNKNASASFADKLTSLAAATPSASGEGAQWWVVTEAYTPTFMGHCAQCHYNGTCVDAGFRGAGDLYAPENVKYFCQEAYAKGLEPVFEITGSDDKKIYTDAGISPLVVEHATGKHFSVYSDQKNRPGACGTVK
jgi:hypothetical protein